MTRDESQLNFVNKWKDNNYKGSLQAVTGYGKTRVSILCMKECNDPDTIVIVPTKELKRQWEFVLHDNELENWEVFVVNTAAKKEIQTELLIIDEMHTTAMADWFSNSWKNARFNKVIGLSASPIRKDGKHKDFLKVSPILMNIDYEEALANGWIANYTIYNVGIELTPKEQLQYNKIDRQLKNLYLNMSAVTGFNIEHIEKNAFDIATGMLSKGKWELIKLGKEYYRLIGLRKNLLYNAENKVKRTINYIEKNPDKKVLIFSQSQHFADEVQNQLGDICVTIHSGIKDKERNKNLDEFKVNENVRVISSIKALNEGVDIPELSVGICASGTSSKKDAIQQLGRVARLYGNKHALFFNLYIKGTQDLYWLKNRQYSLDQSKIIWI